MSCRSIGDKTQKSGVNMCRTCDEEDALIERINKAKENASGEIAELLGMFIEHIEREQDNRLDAMFEDRD